MRVKGGGEKVTVNVCTLRKSHIRTRSPKRDVRERTEILHKERT